MPKQTRLDTPSVLHHIMIRGIDRRKIFINGRIGMNMLEGLAEIQMACYYGIFTPNPVLIPGPSTYCHRIEANALFSKEQNSKKIYKNSI